MPNGRTLEDEFKLGRPVRLRDDYELRRSWQKGYDMLRLSPGYVANLYRKDPQAVFKVVSFGRGIAAKSIMEYVNTREGVEQTFYSESAEVLKGQADIDALYHEWSQDFRKKGSGRGEQRHVTHMLLSADVAAGERNAQRVLDAARETLWHEYGQSGYEYIFVLHQDTEHPHVHVVLKNYNRQTQRKLSIDRHDLLRVRGEFAEQLTKRRLRRHIATLRRDRPAVLHRVENNLQQIRGQKRRMDHLLDNCVFINTKTQLNAQLSKKLGRLYDYENAAIEIDESHTSNIKLISNQQGKPFEDILKGFKLPPQPTVKPSQTAPVVSVRFLVRSTRYCSGSDPPSV